MAKVLIIAEHDGTMLNPSTAKCIACAAEISGAEIDVAVFAADGSAISAQVSQLDSVSKGLDQLTEPNNGVAVRLARLEGKIEHLDSVLSAFSARAERRTTELKPVD